MQKNIHIFLNKFSTTRILVSWVAVLRSPWLMITGGSLIDRALQWRHNEHDGVSNHRRLDCLFNRFFMRRSKKTAKLRVTGLCEGNPPVTGGFPSLRASNTENVSIWLRHHGLSEIVGRESNYNHCFPWDIIINPCLNFNGGLAKLPLKLGHGWGITPYSLM